MSHSVRAFQQAITARNVLARFKGASASPEIVKKEDVARLPAGSIVCPRSADGGVDSPLVVLSNGKLCPSGMLPNRAGEEREMDGEPVSGWPNKEFALISKGKGKLPTRGTADKQVSDWMRTHQGR